VSGASSGLAELLEARDDPMVATLRSAWLKGYAKVPRNAAAPLAMSPPHPRAVGSYGADLLRWARREHGFHPRWWQGLAITRQLEHDRKGALVWREIIETGPRRIGKSVRLRNTATWRTAHADLIGERQLSMLVSKDLAIGREIHRPSWEWAARQGWNVIRLNGAQEIESPTGDRWLLRAVNAVYGYDVCYGQGDEAWSIDPPAITEGLEPALLERKSPQLHLTSTAHVKASSLMRRRVVAALRGLDPDVLLLFWGAHPADDWSLLSTWKRASPYWTPDRRALISRKYNAALAGETDPEIDDPDPMRGWASQYLNVWPVLVGSSGSLIMPAWPYCATSELPGPPKALGLAGDPDGVWISVGACSTDVVPHLGPVKSAKSGQVLRSRISDRATLKLLAADVARIQREHHLRVVADAKGGLKGTIAERELKDAGVSIDWVGLEESIAAAKDLETVVEAKEVCHAEYPELDAAMEAAGWRNVGDRRLLARRSGEISMLEAVALAHWGASQSPASFFGGWR